jgi:hypothetical protein
VKNIVERKREGMCWIGGVILVFEDMERKEREEKKGERVICAIRGVSNHFAPHCMLCATPIYAFFIFFLHYMSIYFIHIYIHFMYINLKILPSFD